MDPSAAPLPPDLQAAIADLRRIRETMDRSRDNHPLRLIGRALMGLTASIGVITVVFGMAAQLVISYLPEGALGFSSSNLIWLMALAAYTAGGLLKYFMLAQASVKVGYDVNRLLKAVLVLNYVRIIVPIFILGTCATLAFAAFGRTEAVVGMITLTVGCCFVALPAVLPVAEYTWIGVILMVFGAFAMFAPVAWPFFVFALILGLPLIVSGLALRHRFPPLANMNAAEKLQEEQLND